MDAVGVIPLVHTSSNTVYRAKNQSSGVISFVAVIAMARQLFREITKTDKRSTAVSAVSEHFDTGETLVLLDVLPKESPRRIAARDLVAGPDLPH